MRFLIIFMCFICTLTSVSISIAQNNWRFGFEWNEAGISWYDPHIENLLVKLEKTGTNGGINVNGVAAWKDMQPGATAAINFKKMDDIVTVFQKHGFSLTPYLNCNASWAFPSKNISQGEAAPDPAFEQHWIDFIKAVVERYDGDGIDDMEGLVIPIRYYVYTGEIVYGGSGRGDAAWGPYWFDTIDNLLHLHRITYKAINEADPTGNTKIVSAGAVLFDLYADFPDYPKFDPADPNSTIQKRLNGENYRGSTYTAGWDSLKKMLDSFGNDADGIECDYIGWHPHGGWRIIDQEFALIHHYAGNKPIHVDDMWTNIPTVGYNAGFSIPGFAQFNAPAWPPEDHNWPQNLHGDFPNTLFPGMDPYGTLFKGLLDAQPDILKWYYAHHAREIVKSFISAFGEGAERACLSGTNDVPEVRNALFGSIGWINFLDVRTGGYEEKPGYYTYKLLIEKLNDFTQVRELHVSDDPRTRVYAFLCPSGTINVLWSETGDAPTDLDYRHNPTGEYVTFKTAGNADFVKLIHIITDTANVIPQETEIQVQNNHFTLQLGYEPVFIEGEISPEETLIEKKSPMSAVSDFDLVRNYPNPFRQSTRIEFNNPAPGLTRIRIYNLLGQEIRCFSSDFDAGWQEIRWDGLDETGKRVQSGLYFIQLKSGGVNCVKKCLKIK